jgi:hypothetical protein
MNRQREQYLLPVMRWIKDEGEDTDPSLQKKSVAVTVNSDEWKLLYSFDHDKVDDICGRLGAGEGYAGRMRQLGAVSYVPQQPDGFNCGVCVCMNADLTDASIPLIGSYSNEHLATFREKIGMDILRRRLLN